MSIRGCTEQTLKTKRNMNFERPGCFGSVKRCDLASETNNRRAQLRGIGKESS